jgi:hypothetical protein
MIELYMILISVIFFLLSVTISRLLLKIFRKVRCVEEEKKRNIKMCIVLLNFVLFLILFVYRGKEE